MEVGKVPTDILKEVIFKNIQHKRSEVLVRPNIGEDCAVVDFGENVCVMSTDPITGAVKDIGSLSIHISCNDIASNGVEPIGVMMTILAPIGTTKEDLSYVMQEANRAAASINVEIIGGHSEITDAVNRMVITTTAIGKQKKAAMVTSKGAQVGDHVIMTKHAGLEGTAIIAADLEDQLRKAIPQEVIDNAKGFAKKISVVKEGVLAGTVGVNSMHDVTEGGILGALWELAEASQVGIEVYEDKIPIASETLKICAELSIDPLRLISSGVMVMAASKEKAQVLLETFKEHAIEATMIGKITKEEKVILKGTTKNPLEAPKTDELYKVI
ncbi:hydrogenase expression/formation protein HypE [Clostridium aceticum]|uniref:Hydrogenase expression/formation protein HypE n=1 Tax=Clostridium aceticum TaxID=84022 RepID=A0A0D8IE83_9CLOT|nr:AIR synthase family protein [Clostridium aceticum]AKL93976.1 hydrogenase expression/formation protein HypE [Clostridium aceticum]KJF28640.1 AIR synthase [Clostridium aceticum]